MKGAPDLLIASLVRVVLDVVLLKDGLNINHCVGVQWQAR